MAKLTRRSALGALAAMAASNSMATPINPLDQLVADWRHRRAELDHWTRKESAKRKAVRLPAGSIKVGQISRELSTEQEIEDLLSPMSWMVGKLRADAIATRDRALDQLRAAQAEREAVRVASGLAAFEDNLRAAVVAESSALLAVYAYRPLSLADWETKAAVVAEVLADGETLQRAELAMIFTHAPHSASPDAARQRVAA